MTVNLIALFVALGVFLVSFIAAALISKRQKVWYKVYLANPEMSELHIYRTGWDKFWRSDSAGIMLFHKPDGKEIRIGKHWILKMEEE